MKNSALRYSRGQLAKLTGVKGETIRYYEKCGLLGTPARSEGGHRIYTQLHVERLGFIRRCRRLDFAISVIRSLVEAMGSRKVSCGQVRESIADQLKDVQEKIEILQDMERVLKGAVSQCDSNASSDCPFLESFELSPA